MKAIDAHLNFAFSLNTNMHSSPFNIRTIFSSAYVIKSNRPISPQFHDARRRPCGSRRHGTLGCAVSPEDYDVHANVAVMSHSFSIALLRREMKKLVAILIRRHWDAEHGAVRSSYRMRRIADSAYRRKKRMIIIFPRHINEIIFRIALVSTLHYRSRRERQIKWRRGYQLCADHADVHITQTQMRSRPLW